MIASACVLTGGADPDRDAVTRAAHGKDCFMAARRRAPLARELPAELQVAATNGSILTDSRGRKYIDFVMGWCVGNFGWRPAAIAKAIERFKGPDYVYPGYAYAPWTELAQLLASLAPRSLTTCFRATGGSEAVDLALQAAMIHTRRRAFLSLEGSYHGNSIAGVSIGASESRERIKNLLPHCGKIPPPLDAKAMRRIEQRLKRRDVAAFVMEPISINLGVLIPEKSMIRRLRDLCLRYGTMFIADEVATGFGRTGRLFACEHFDLDPDMLCVAKAMSGGLAPIGAVIATAPIAQSMEEHGAFYSTYGWHPRSVAAAIASLRDLKANRRRLLACVAEMSEYFRVRLLQLEFDRPAAIRIQGLAIGIDVGDEDYADAIHDKCRRNGLLVSTEGSTVLLLPSLAIDKRTAARGLDALARSI
jgi:acetylornithine/succinyldiaminopimelate/putrescine aminotransferase